MDNNLLIKLKRTSTQYQNSEGVSNFTDKTLSFGEPLYFDYEGDKYLAIGNKGSDAVDTLPVFKAYNQAVVDNAVFYNLVEKDGDNVQLINESEETIYPTTKAEYVSSSSGKSVEEMLAGKQDKIDILSIKNGGTGTNSFNPNEVLVSGDVGAEAITTRPFSDGKDISSTGTAIVTEGVLNDYVRDQIYSVNYAGSDIRGGAANFVHSHAVTEDEESKKLYIVGVEDEDQELNFCKTGNKYANGVYVDSKAGILHGAAWNDFAEFRKCKEDIPGACVTEKGDGYLELTTKRLQPGCSIITDTCGMIIGLEDEESVPIAVAGRVLAYVDGGSIWPGAAVCSAPDGKVSVMTRSEIANYPDCIVGYISEVPTYDEWNGVQVNNRIWIKVK